MNRHSDPLEYVLNCCECGLVPQLFDVLNAKDQLKQMRQELINSYINIGWVKVNSRGDLYDPRLQLNPFEEKQSIPLYANKEEFKSWLDKNR